MTENPWGYVDPVQRVRRQQAMRGAPLPYPVQLRQVQSPLANLPAAEYQVLSNPGVVPERRNVAESMLLGGIVGGLLGLLLSRRRELKRQRQGWTTSQ